jgi:glucosamine--fructose-6-phosphate aminotransferase (isomerizing)
LLEAGAESTVSCKTYLSTLAVLHWLGAMFIHSDGAPALKEIAQAEIAVRDYLSRLHGHVAELLPMLDGIQSIFVTGRGDSLATAGTGGLILKESTRLHAEGMSAAAFRHGPLEMAGTSALVLIFEGGETTAPLHRRLAADIVNGGGRASLIGPHTTGPAAFQLPFVLQPLVEILPIQMVSLALAARDGFEAGCFSRASKITDIA